MRKIGFDERLRTALLESGWTQERLAARLNVTQATVSRWLAGKFLPSPKAMPDLAATLDVEMQWLVDGTGHKQRIYANNEVPVNPKFAKKPNWRHAAFANYLPPEESPDARARLDQARHYLSLFLGELSERQIIAKISEILSDHEMAIIHRIVISQEMLGELARRNGFRAADGSQKNDG